MKKIKTLLKNNKIIYYLYNYIGSFVLNVIGLFIKTDNKLVLFNSYGGKKYDDSPKAIYEYMLKSGKYKDYKLIWALDNSKLVEGLNIEYVKNNSIKFFITALKAKYWITNSSMERGLKFKKKNTIYINTWHGTAIKHIGIDENKNAFVKFRVSKSNIRFAQSDYDIKIFSHCSNLPEEIFAKVGLPRNDELCNVSEKEKNKIKNKLRLPLNKKIILYAPTFREYSRDINGCLLAPPIDLKMWQKELSNDYILLFRAHYEVNTVLGIEENAFLKNYSSYENLNELMKISDILISDYSSIMIDYSILERPIFNYIYDYDEYNQKRGLYFDIRKKLPGNCFEKQEDLINKIKNINYDEECKKTRKFKNEFVEVCGNARQYIDKIILNRGEKK